MKCPFCASQNTSVVDSRLISNGLIVRRRRECMDCHRRFSTHEMLSYDTITVMKKSGKKEKFQSSKIERSINTALAGMVLDSKTKEDLFSDLTMRLYKIASDHNGVLSTREIGDEILQSLKGLSEVAYIRFASIYRQFKDVSGFMEAMEDMMAKHDKE